MMRGARIAVLLLLGTLSLPADGLGQAVSGALRGNVVAEAGRPLAGAVVTVVSPALQGERQTTSDTRGAFLFPSLPTGTYSVQLRRIGYAPLRMTDVAVYLGFTTSVDLELKPQAVQLDEIVVSGARARLDLTSAATGTVLDSARFRLLPTGRDYTTLLGLIPEGSPSPYGDGVSFGGATGYDNKYFVDGIHASNPLSSDGSIRVPYNFIKEVQVVSSGYEAEFGRSQGAVVNVVTNSGGNQFHGEAVAFYTGNHLRASPRFGIAERPSDDFSHYDVGISFGGPIQRDRLWFYTAYNPLFEDKDVSFTGIASQPDRLIRHLFAGKLTWRPVRGSDVSFTVLGDPSSRDAVEGAEAWTAPLPTVSDPRVVLGAYRDGGWSGALRWRQQAGNHVLVSATISHLTNVHQVARRSGSDDPVSLARIDDITTSTSSGNWGRSYRVNTARSAADVSLTLLGSRHTVKLGANYEYNTIHIPFFKQSFVTHNLDGTWQWYANHWEGHGHSSVPAIYAQDSWELTPRIRANFGLRWEGQFIAGDTGRGVTISGEFAPRLGLVFQPGALGTQKLFVSAGRFYEQLPMWPVSALTMPFSFLAGVYPQNPLVDRSGGQEVAVDAGSIVVAARNLRGQSYDEITAGYERSVGNATRIGVRGIVRGLNWALESPLATADPENPSYLTFGLLGNPGRGALAQYPRGTRRYAGLELTLERAGSGRLSYLASYVLSRAYGNLPGEFDSDSRVPASHTQGQTASPDWWTHSTGYLPSDRRHLVKLSGSYQIRKNLGAGMAGWFGTGLPLSEFGFDPLGNILFIKDRGTNGRTPSTWNVDFRFVYDVATLAGRWNPRLTVDLYNIGNQRRAVDFEQTHYNDTGSNPNPNYLKVNRYQAPLSARLGVLVGF